MSLSGNVWNRINSSWRQLIDSSTIAWDFTTDRDQASVGIVAASIGTTQLTASSVTYAKIQNVAASSRVLGRVSAGSGVVEEVPIGITSIASGSLTGAAVVITSIPATYAHLILVVAASSSGSTEQTQVQVSVDNGSNYDATGGNYVGVMRTGTTFTATSTASLTESATHTAAQTDAFTLYLYGYQGGPHMSTHARIIANATEYMCDKTYIGSTSAINALKILGSAAGTFDAGTYALYGVR